MNIVGDSVVLRAIELEDVDALHRWSNDPLIQAGLGRTHFPVSKAALQGWVETFRYDSTDQRFIVDANGAGAVGLVTLTDINWKDRNAFHGVLIGERRHQRKGYARDAVLTIMSYAFEELGLERLDTTIVEFNTASLGLHVEKCGWSEEGRKRRATFRRGRFWDVVVLGVTRESFAGFHRDRRSASTAHPSRKPRAR
jgi:RimJ/RimL family protein N-acetyltransferase